jgi:hypothetical protein
MIANVSLSEQCSIIVIQTTSYRRAAERRGRTWKSLYVHFPDKSFYHILYTCSRPSESRSRTSKKLARPQPIC